MAALSASQAPKRRKQVYGKLVSRSNWNVDSFFDEDELASSEPAQTTRQRQPTDKARPAAKTNDSATSAAVAPIPTRPRPKRHDTFDIPSSDDEVAASGKLASPPRFHKKSALVDDTDGSTSQLAPWERRKLQSDREKTPKKKKSIRSTTTSPEAQLKQDLIRAASSPEAAKSTGSSPRVSPGHGRGRRVAPLSQTSEPEHLSAMARLAARRQDVGQPPSSKRFALPAEDSQSTPRKRAKMSPDRVVHGAEHVSIREADPVATRDSPVRIEDDGMASGDVYDFQASSGDEQPARKPRNAKLRPTSRTTKRGKLTMYSSRSGLHKGLSAPARLSEMLTDTDTTEAPTRSPSAASRRSTPQQQPSTPGRSDASPENATPAIATMTPKQARLWHELLPSDTVAPSPSALPIKDLNISGKRRTSGSLFAQKLVKSHTTIPRRQTRLVDRLKAFASNSDSDSAVEDDNDDDDVDVEMEEEIQTEHTLASAPERPALLKRMSSQASQSQSQAASIANIGPKITYAQSRSYLHEDSLEQDFMAGFAADSPQLSTQTKRNTDKSAPASQKSAFDLEDSDDEAAAAGKIRTIHELRASGRNVSGMYDIEELLGEIQNHSASYRSRRRSALIDLATKLMDKTFAVRFTGQSLETELAAECGAASDEVADFVLSAAIVLVLVSEPPEHALRSLRDQGVVAWMVRLLDRNVEVNEMAKDRRSNMSKAAQGSLIGFGEMLKRQSSVRGDVMPVVVTSRLLALKGLDLLISKLRRCGDRSELLGHEHVASVLLGGNELANANKEIDLDLSISILESLSTTTASLSWPASTLNAIAETLLLLNLNSATQQHALFLVLRLCLNLTNDNAQNCQLLTKAPAVVQYLLEAVKQGFDSLDSELEDEKRALALDLLVLAMGIMINLAEHCDAARQQTLLSAETLSSLLVIFQNGQKHMLEAESVEESVTNVAFGYLAVMMSNLCRSKDTKDFIAQRLPGKNLGMLIEAVEEFVLHHQRVDMMNFEGEEGMEVWGAFTEKLKLVLERLKEVEVGI